MNGGGGGEPVTRIVLHWQRCTVAPEAGGGHGGEGGGQPDAENGRAPPVVAAAADRPTDRGTSAKNEGLVGGRAMDVILACLPPTRPPTSPILLPSFFPAFFPFIFLQIFLFSFFLFFFFFSSIAFSPSSVSSRTLSRGRPTGGVRNNRTSGNVTWNISKLQCIMDTCTHTRSQSSYKGYEEYE